MSIELKGLKEVVGNLNKYSARVAKEIDATLTDGANRIEERAKILAPVDEDILRGSIIAEIGIPFNKVVGTRTFYAPYVEFGTGRKFKDGGYPQEAAKHKGKSSKGGTFEDFIKSMYLYIKRHGGFPKDARTEAEKINYTKFVCLKIIKNGIKAQPFFFRAFDEIKDSILNDVKAVIK